MNKNLTLIPIFHFTSFLLHSFLKLKNMTYTDPIIVSDGPTDPEYEDDFESPGASPIRAEEEDYSLNPYEEEEETFRFFEEEDEEEVAKKRKLRQIIGVLDKLRRLLVEFLDE